MRPNRIAACGLAIIRATAAHFEPAVPIAETEPALADGLRLLVLLRPAR